MEKIPSQKRTLVKRIVLFGPESTGKTTLAKQLSEKYDVPWVAEYAREYLQEKWDPCQSAAAAVRRQLALFVL